MSQPILDWLEWGWNEVWDTFASVNSVMKSAFPKTSLGAKPSIWSTASLRMEDLRCACCRNGARKFLKITRNKLRVIPFIPPIVEGPKLSTQEPSLYNHFFHTTQHIRNLFCHRPAKAGHISCDCRLLSSQWSYLKASDTLPLHQPGCILACNTHFKTAPP